MPCMKCTPSPEGGGLESFIAASAQTGKAATPPLYSPSNT